MPQHMSCQNFLFSVLLENQTKTFFFHTSYAAYLLKLRSFIHEKEPIVRIYEIVSQFVSHLHAVPRTTPSILPKGAMLVAIVREQCVTAETMTLDVLLN